MADVFSDGIDATPTEKSDEETVPQQAEGGQEPQQSEQPPAEGNEAAEARLEDLPEKWQQHIKDLRRENARRRTEAKAEPDSDLRERLAAVELQLEDAQAEAEKAKALQRKTELLSERGLDHKFAPMLSGETAEEWEAAADSLVELRGPVGSRPDPVQAAASKNIPSKSVKERAADAFFAGLNK